MGKLSYVIISSPWQDLQSERGALEEALHHMRNTASASMEYFSRWPETPKEVNLIEIDRREIYIGILTHRYDSGITEAEYRQALGRGLPCLIYFKDNRVPTPPTPKERYPEKSAKLGDFKRELKDHHTVSFLTNSDNLAAQVTADMYNFLHSTGRVREAEQSQRGSKHQISATDSEEVIIGDQTQIIQPFGTPSRPQRHEPGLLRLQRLADNIRHDLALVKKYDDRLHRSQLVATQDGLDAIKAKRVPDVIDTPRSTVKHKLKIAAPIIPFILSYQGEIELTSGLNLQAAWKRLLSKLRGGR